jgi:hypothetical protein
MIRMTVSCAILVFALALAPAISALAQSAGPGTGSGEGYLTATTCGKLPEPLRLDVQAMDDTVENMQLRKILIDRLMRQGIAVNAGAPNVLRFEVVRTSRPTRYKGRDLGEFRSSKEENARIRLNVWSSKSDSLLGGRRKGVISEAVDRLQIAVTVNAKGDGRCLWRAEAVHDVAGRDPKHIASKMIAPLAEAVGKAVARKPIYVE